MRLGPLLYPASSVDSDHFGSLPSGASPLYSEGIVKTLQGGIDYRQWARMKKFYGLTGVKLNIAIAVIAGTDFALFGYGMSHHLSRNQNLTNMSQTKASWAVYSLWVLSSTTVSESAQVPSQSR